MSVNRNFQIISEEEVEEPAAQAVDKNAAITAANTQLLLTALRALSQRAMTAITNLFSAGLVLLTWLLWRGIPNPTTHQLIALGGFAVFCLLLDTVRRSRK